MFIHDCIRDAIKKGMHKPEGMNIYSNMDFVPDDPEEMEMEPENLYENYNPAYAGQQGNHDNYGDDDDDDEDDEHSVDSDDTDKSDNPRDSTDARNPQAMWHYAASPNDSETPKEMLNSCTDNNPAVDSKPASPGDGGGWAQMNGEGSQEGHDDLEIPIVSPDEGSSLGGQVFLSSSHKHDKA